VKLSAAPAQPYATGATRTVATTVETPALDAVNAAIPPVPDGPSPIETSLFDHANSVPDTGPLNETADVADPAHTDCPGGTDTDGVG
jgi:hypothetical protein